jgi:hypothetical protein
LAAFLFAFSHIPCTLRAARRGVILLEFVPAIDTLDIDFHEQFFLRFESQ